MMYICIYTGRQLSRETYETTHLQDPGRRSAVVVQDRCYACVRHRVVNEQTTRYWLKTHTYRNVYMRSRVLIRLSRTLVWALRACIGCACTRGSCSNNYGALYVDDRIKFARALALQIGVYHIPKTVAGVRLYYIRIYSIQPSSASCTTYRIYIYREPMRVAVE